MPPSPPNRHRKRSSQLHHLCSTTRYHQQSHRPLRITSPWRNLQPRRQLKCSMDRRQLRHPAISFQQPSHILCNLRWRSHDRISKISPPQEQIDIRYIGILLSPHRRTLRRDSLLRGRRSYSNAGHFHCCSSTSIHQSHPNTHCQLFPSFRQRCINQLHWNQQKCPQSCTSPSNRCPYNSHLRSAKISKFTSNITCPRRTCGLYPCPPRTNSKIQT